MPQFELEKVGKAQMTGIVRARNMEQAIRQNTGATADTDIDLTLADELQGWYAISMDGVASGQIREHSRMKFRRD